ncbi:MAG: CoA transferase [Variibacter sp.]|nr:CoA transferase [Variibacter sp.]
MTSRRPLPLAGIKVLELGQLIAGPFCGRMLADFGAEVVKVEPPGHGDPLRNWRILENGTSFWWHAQSRNKKSVAIDLRTAEGQALVRSLAAEADVLIENFRPGTLEKWGLGDDVLKADNPQLVLLRVSGYGQTGPKKDLAGFGVIAEAVGGLRHLTGEPGRVPVRVGVSIGDSLAALHGVIGVLIALYDRDARNGKGQVVDVALYEAVFNIMESLLSEYDGAGVCRQPAGAVMPGIAPSNAYRCRDGIVLIAGNSDGVFRRLMAAIGRPDLAARPDLTDNAGRVAGVGEIDDAIEAWTRVHTVAEALAVLEDHAVPAGRIYTAADIAGDPHYLAREMIVRQRTYDGRDLAVPGIVPKLSGTPGKIDRRAPRLGEDTEAVLCELGLGADQIADLRARNVIQ